MREGLGFVWGSCRLGKGLGGFKVTLGRFWLGWG